MPMCKKCFIIYIKNNSGWCPYCRQHLLFKGLGKTDLQNNDMDIIFDDFIGYEMRTCINQTNAVNSVDASYLVKKWETFVNNM